MERTIPTGGYVICNFGPEGDTGSNFPVYLGDPAMGIEPHKFTGIVSKAATYTSKMAAEIAMKSENAKLMEEGTAGRLRIAEVRVRVVPIGE